MGQCGCGDLCPDKVFKITNKWYLVVSKYLGCQDCDTPIGVILNLMTKDEIEEWSLEDMVEKFPDAGNGNLEYTIPFLGRNEMEEAVKELENDGRCIDEYEDLSDYMHDAGLEILQAGCRKYKELYPRKE